tara:strand:- start:1822 stop:2220 length:399 start_codon:yes stop_codon:yes gene_type:complete
MRTGTEIEHGWSAEKPTDPFDAAAKSLYLALNRITHLFKSKNIRVNASVTVEDYGYEVTSIGWDGLNGCLTVELKKELPCPASALAGSQPWLMTPVILHAEALLEEAIKQKELVTEHMVTVDGTLDWIEEKA